MATKDTGSTGNTGGDTLDDTPRAEPLYSPVCTYCKWWEAHPDRWQQCSAWPSTGKTPIPQPIWAGNVTHVFPYPGDHGIQFEAVAGAKLPAKIRADLKKRAAQQQQQERPKTPTPVKQA